MTSHAEAVICALEELKWWLRSKINVWNKPENTQNQQAASALSVFSPPSRAPTLHRCQTGAGVTYSSLPDVGVPPILMPSLLTEPSGPERESATGPIHPGALPSGPGASETAWELAGVGARQPSWSRFGWFHQSAWSKMCRSHFREHVRMVAAGVCASRSPKCSPEP